jgi:hypothetical protein
MLYGRDRERAEIWALLEQARASRSGALVLRGEAGIGKTALLEDARDRATDMHVLRARGVESESELPFAGLHQLLRPALDHVDRLPAPQATALRGALGLDEGASSERFLIFAACLSLVSELAERRPVLCLVDDAHWLDAGTTDALLFVARRLDAEGIAMLFGVREGDVRTFEAPDLPSLVVEGLDPASAANLLTSGRGASAAPGVRDLLVERTSGNALALLEVPSALTDEQLAGTEPLPEELPLTRQLETVFLQRVRRLSPDSQRLLLVAAADDLGTVALVTRAGERLGLDDGALDGAERAGLVTLRGTRLAFRHPLVRSALYGAASAGDRWAAHRALADALEGDAEHADRRAWHLASAAAEPDEEVVQQLEDAASRSEQRGAHAAAARALERAAELTSDPAARSRRLVHSALAWSAAGADQQAVACAMRAGGTLDDPVLRAEVARVIGLAGRRRGRPADAHPRLLDGAAEVATVAPRLALELLWYAIASASEGGVEGGIVAATRLAGTIEPPEDDDEAEFLSNLLVGWGAMYEGDMALGAKKLGLAGAWAARTDDERLAYWGTVAPLMTGDDEGLAAILARAAPLARSRGAVGTLAEILTMTAAQLLLEQRFDRAEVAAREAVQLGEELNATNVTTLPQTVLSVIAAVRGDDAEAEHRASRVLDVATSNGLVTQAALATWAQGVLYLTRGRWDEALDRLRAAGDVDRVDPVVLLFSLPDLIEAAVRAGRHDDAHAALAAFEDWASGAAPAWTRPRLAGFRALVAEGDEAGRHFAEAIELAGDARPSTWHASTSRTASSYAASGAAPTRAFSFARPSRASSGCAPSRGPSGRARNCVPPERRRASATRARSTS